MEIQPGFIISSYNLNMSYSDDTVLMAGTEKKVQDLLDRVIKEKTNHKN